jgi:DNA-binding transcriptional MerR regulator
MKAASSLLSAASAVALSAGLIVTGAGALQLATLTVAEAAVVSSIEVRGNRRVSAETIRHYTEIGLLQPKRDPVNGYKLFIQSDVNRVMFIRRAKHLGYTLNEIRQIFEECRKGNSHCQMTREII